MTSQERILLWRLPVVVAAIGLMFMDPSGARAAFSSHGALAFVPVTGSAADPLSVVSAGICHNPLGTHLQVRVVGAGFPAGANVTPNLSVHVYSVEPRRGGYYVPLQDTLEHFAAQQAPPARLSGRYDFTLTCKPLFGPASYETYTGSVLFSSPTHFRALSSVVPTKGTAVGRPSSSPSAAASPARPTASPGNHAQPPAPRKMLPPTMAVAVSSRPAAPTTPQLAGPARRTGDQRALPTPVPRVPRSVPASLPASAATATLPRLDVPDTVAGPRSHAALAVSTSLLLAFAALVAGLIPLLWCRRWAAGRRGP